MISKIISLLNFYKISFLSLFFLSIFSSSIYIDLGFSLKLFMIFTGVSFFNKKNLLLVNDYDILFLILILYGFTTVLFSEDIENGFRMVLGSVILILFYFKFKSILLTHLDKSILIHDSLVTGVFLFSFLSIFGYFFNMFLINFDFINNNNKQFSCLVIERGVPRMIGFANDPNILVFTVLVPFWYLFFKENKCFFDRITFILIILCILFSLSRGGLISVFIPLIFIYLFIFKIKFKYFLIIIIFLFSIYYIKNTFVLDILQKRLYNISSGSGRFEIWNNALELFTIHPLFGVGWYNFLFYNANFYGGKNYVHNTFLEVLVELGLIGFLIYLIFHFLLLRKIIALVNISSEYYYLLFSYVSSLILMSSLSLIINEVFFIIPGLISFHIYNIRLNENSTAYFSTK